MCTTVPSGTESLYPSVRPRPRRTPRVRAVLSQGLQIKGPEFDARLRPTFLPNPESRRSPDPQLGLDRKLAEWIGLPIPSPYRLSEWQTDGYFLHIFTSDESRMTDDLSEDRGGSKTLHPPYESPTVRTHLGGLTPSRGPEGSTVRCPGHAVSVESLRGYLYPTREGAWPLQPSSRA